MSVIRINATPNGLSLHDNPQPVSRRLHGMAFHPGPVVILVHGYKYLPGNPDFCPHEKIFSDRDDAWPRQLGLMDGAGSRGLCIALGWQARGSLRAMYLRAQRLGKSIADLIVLLRRQNPDRAIHIVAHSLGSEACLCALSHLQSGMVSRMVLLTGVSYARRAANLLSTPAGRSTEVLNITSRENDIFDAMFERVVPAEVAHDRTIGQGIAVSNAVTVQLDCPDTLIGLERLGFAIAAPQRRICHWSAYTRPGVMAFYGSFLSAPDRLPLALIADTAPDRCAPRWSRLFALPSFSSPVRAALLHREPDPLRSEATPVEALVARSTRNEPAY